MGGCLGDLGFIVPLHKEHDPQRYQRNNQGAEESGQNYHAYQAKTLGPRRSVICVTAKTGG
jgi:hypothetical protein